LEHPTPTLAAHNSSFPNGTYLQQAGVLPLAHGLVFDVFALAATGERIKACVIKEKIGGLASHARTSTVCSLLSGTTQAPGKTHKPDRPQAPGLTCEDVLGHIDARRRLGSAAQGVHKHLRRQVDLTLQDSGSRTSTIQFGYLQ
jgi:hypothetical protein